MQRLLRKQIKIEQELVRFLLTDGTEIRGKVHLLPEHRLLDLLNSGASNGLFLAATKSG